MKLNYYSYTNQGGRAHNEDSIKVVCSEGKGTFVLADGLGGHDCGEVASAIAVDVIAGNTECEEKEELKSLFEEANKQILEQQSTLEHEKMKTTAVALRIDRTQAEWAHIGDSRLYYFSGDELQRVTKDHSVSYMKYLGGEISYMDVYHDDDRSSLLRVLGKEKCTIDTDSVELKSGDSFLLCSDGFWEYVYNEEILIDWLKADNPKEWINYMLLRHIQRTPENNDNFSVIAVCVEE